MKKVRRSSRLINFSVIVVLCLGLVLIAGLYKPSRSQYDQTPFSNYPIELSCQLLRIIDGDSITVKCPTEIDSEIKTVRSIRFWGMDAPETGQEPWGAFSTSTLAQIIGQETFLTIKIMNQDRYNRFIAQVYLNGQDVGLIMVQKGAAVVYQRYNRAENYINAEKKAKMAGLGIWAVSGAQQNPEGWRRFNP